MFYVYVLFEVQSKKIYIGYTGDLKQRVAEHKNGKACRTTAKGDWQLVYYEAFSAKEDAMMRERKLKHHGMTKRKLFERLVGSLAGKNRAGCCGHRQGVTKASRAESAGKRDQRR
jgi:putative endonuclease